MSQGSRLRASDVHYLSFQGGGAKGSAYLGALAAFAEPQINIFKDIYDAKKGAQHDWVLNTDNQKIKGVAGASAGAITATLVACGYSLRELYTFLTSDTILSFYDDATPRMIPQVNSQQSNNACTSCEEKDMPSVWSMEDWDQITGALMSPGSIGIGLLLSKSIIMSLPTALKEKLDNDKTNYLKNLFLDFGFFSGCKARQTFDEMISKKVKEKTKRAGYGITFAQFSSIFNVDLKLTGTNLRTESSKYFSKDTTPDLKVVDALRISMSFPIAFKPVVIGENALDKSLQGTWIDGGLLNNNPIHAFDEPKGIINPGVFGLRLNANANNDIKNLVDFLTAMKKSLIDAGDLGQIKTAQEEAQTQVLNPGNINVLDFAPSKDVLKSVINNAYETVMDYFGANKNYLVSTLTGILPSKK